jgi:hypothetical protein
MFAKKKKKIEISAPSNFQHRVHTGFDPSNNKFVGLPLQWHSIVRDEAGATSPHRPHPVVDPSTYTPVKGDTGERAGSVVRSNSLRASSPPMPRMRREQSNLLPPVPEYNGNESQDSGRSGGGYNYHPASQGGYGGGGQQQQQQFYGVINNSSGHINNNNSSAAGMPHSRPNSVLYSGPPQPHQHQQQRFSTPPGAAYNNIPPGPGSNRSAGSGGSDGGSSNHSGPYRVAQPGVPPLQRPGNPGFRPGSTLPVDSVPGGIPGYDPAAVRAANMARAEALSAQQREESAMQHQQQQMQQQRDQLALMRMQQLNIDPRQQQQQQQQPLPPRNNLANTSVQYRGQYPGGGGQQQQQQFKYQHDPSQHLQSQQQQQQQQFQPQLRPQDSRQQQQFPSSQQPYQQQQQQQQVQYQKQQQQIQQYQYPPYQDHPNSPGSQILPHQQQFRQQPPTHPQSDAAFHQNGAAFPAHHQHQPPYQRPANGGSTGSGGPPAVYPRPRDQPDHPLPPPPPMPKPVVSPNEEALPPANHHNHMPPPAPPPKISPPKVQGWKNPVFFLKPSPVGFLRFFWVFLFFLYSCPEERVFWVFSVSRILLGASRL